MINLQQKAVIEAPPGKIMCVACPGSGKTFCMISKIIYEIKQRKMSPSAILAMTFTRKAAAELKERVAKELTEDIAKQISIGTIHGWCYRNIVRVNPMYFGFAHDNLRLVTSYEKIIKNLEFADQLDSKEIAVLSQHFSQCIGRGIKFESEDQARFNTMRAYQFKNNCMTCDDIIYFAYQRLKEDETFRRKLAARFELVICDECQDNSPSQTLIAQHLSSVHNFLVIVGDDSQCQPPDTEVITDARSCPISHLKRGDLVTSYDGSSLGTRKILGVHSRHYEGDLFVIEAAGRITRCTPYHKFLIKQGGCIFVLQANEIQLLTLLTPLLLVPVYDEQRVSWVPFTISKETYNGDVYSLAVEFPETYIADGIITHNSIYSWRQAEPKHFIDLQNKGFKLYKLEYNYRSHQKILDLASEVIKFNEGVQIDKKIIAINPSPSAPKPRLMLFNLRSRVTEVQWIARNINRMLTMEGVDPQDIAILCRSVNSGTGRALQAELRSLRIKYRVVGGVDFVDSMHVQRLFCCFALAAGANHLEDWRELLSLMDGVGAKAVRLLLEKVPDTTAMLALLKKEKAKLQLIELTKTLSSVKKNRKDSSRCVGIFSDWYLQFIDDDHDTLNKAGRYFDSVASASSKLDILDTIEQFTLETEDEEKSDPNSITISTIHGYKGLETAFVFIPDVQDKMIPHMRSQTAEEIQEECRVFYVGLTRAKKDLCLTATTTKDTRLSRFLTPDILDNYLDVKQL